MTTPKKYRKKPVTVEASQWWEAGDHDEVGLYLHPPVDPITGDVSAADDAIWMGEMRHSEVPERFRRETCDALMDDHGWIDTLEGGHTVCPGDYIIRGVQGEFYPCKPDIFAATYEEAEGVTTNIDLDKAREWANLKRYSWSEGSKAAAEVIQSLPDLPEPHAFPNGEKEWYTPDGWVNLDPDGTITIVYDERDEDDIIAGAEIASGELVFTRLNEANDLAIAFLAAIDHAKKDMADTTQEKE